MGTLMPKSQPRNRAGVIIVYAICIMVAFMALASFAVDYGRMRLARTQLQMATDASVLYGVTGLATSTSQATSRAITAAAENKVDGSACVITSSDVEFGVWDPTTRSFTVLTGSAQISATAMRVKARKTVPTVFASILGRTSVEVETKSIATRGKSIKPSIGAQGCPWLAGMPNNSTVAATDGNTQPSRAPAQSPTAVSGIDLSAGTKISFRQASGQTSWDDGSDGSFGPDGDTSWIVQQAAANGINSTQAPIGALVGIFLDNRAPNTYSQASAGNFSTSSSQNFTTLAPPLKQVFFIGDGLNSSNVLQQFTVPNGATRLYLGVMDEKGWWWDNTGTIATTIIDDHATLVQ